MSEPAAAPDQGSVLLALYDRALPQVYGYLVSRCGIAAVAEDLTSETFMAAVDAVQRGTVPTLTVGWLVGVARHKLIDHWRAQARDQRKIALVESASAVSHDALDEWDTHLDVMRANDVLATLEPHHRGALTLRYLDGYRCPKSLSTSAARCTPPKRCSCALEPRFAVPTAKGRTDDHRPLRPLRRLARTGRAARAATRLCQRPSPPRRRGAPPDTSD